MPKFAVMYIAIAGNIGSGKSTLTRMLAEYYGWEARHETVDTNPYIDDYYRDLKRWAFNMEIFFLKERFRDQIAIAKATHDIVQDRTIYEGVYIFMEYNRAVGNISERDYTTYMELFNQMVDIVGLPRLMIYLRASVPHLVSNIQRRGRDYEQAMPIDYLESLNRRYDEFIFSKYKGPVMVIEKDGLDFEHDSSHFAQIVSQIDQRLYGLFS